MLGKVASYVAVYCLGFTTGLVYTSNKCDRQPAEMFKELGSDAIKVKDTAVDKTKAAASSVASKFKKNNTEEAAEVVDTTETVEVVNAEPVVEEA